MPLLQRIFFESLAKYTKIIKTLGSEIDHIIPSDDAVESGRIAVYCNGQSPTFAYHCRLTVSMRRPNLQDSIYIGFAPIAQIPLGEKTKGGITVVAGWNPKKRVEERQDYLYIRAQ
ncbi:MAG: hypothetical protein ACM3MK_14035 [Chitinophagales bacterium]